MRSTPWMCIEATRRASWTWVPETQWVTRSFRHSVWTSGVSGSNVILDSTARARRWACAGERPYQLRLAGLVSVFQNSPRFCDV